MNSTASTTLKLLGLLLLACVPLSGESFYVELAAKTLVLAIFAMSLDLLVGFTGLVSFGHAAYFGVAAYAVALLSPSTKPPACGTCCRPRSGCRPWLHCWSASSCCAPRASTSSW